MENVNGMEAQKKSPVQGIIETVKQVIMDPSGFYRGMPKAGGFGPPLVFAVVLGLVAGVIQAVLGLVHLGGGAAGMAALGLVIFVPIWVLIGGFIGAAIVYVIWKLMGSTESYETAYRCGAYSMAVAPITTLASVIPVAGSLVGLAWMVYLLVIATVEVHKLPSRKAWLVFGIIGALLALMSLGSQSAARKVQYRSDEMQKELQKMGINAEKPMTPEDAGKAAAAMMKALQEQALKQAQEQQKANDE